jgi:NAD(P)-dependent dehydrogenase (short-subunit alcohol dehydrogenase family)
VGQLDGKVAIVTGAGRGIGRAIALLFAQEGAKVAAVSRTKATLDATVKGIEEAGGTAIAIPCDVTSKEAVDAAVEATVAAFGTVHVLVNNAHDRNGQQSPFLETTEAKFQQQLATGLFATVHFMQACYPYLKAHQGKVINFASGAGVLGAFGFTPYAASKEAIRGVSRVAAREWGADRINVNIICPTSMTDALEESIRDPAILEIVARTPLGIPGSPYTDVAPVALFLATDACNYITGHSFHVDGGNLMDAGR